MSIEHSHIAGREIRAVRLPKDRAKDYKKLRKFGIDFSNRYGEDQVRNMQSTMDAVTPSVTTATIPALAQKLQYWVPGMVYVATAPLKIDVLTGRSIVGDWADEEIIQTIMELLGSSVTYQDDTNTPLSSWNTQYERRTIQRFEEGMKIGTLESERSGKMGINNVKQKREAAIKALDIRRNDVGFNGFNSGNDRTYGYLNDPGLPAYVTVAAGASTLTTWASKTWLEIQKDIVTMAVALLTQSKGLINVQSSMPSTLAVSTAAYGNLARTNEYGISVFQWIKNTYPSMRVEEAPELDGANGGANVAYLYADNFVDNSTDGGQVFDQWVQVLFKALGVEQKIKGFEESFSNATAGVVCKRPFAVYRASGI
jgi:hypothetical protein